MRYVTLGEVPPKRHAQVWRGSNGDRRLLVEGGLRYGGFSGNESILYHLHSPCRLDRVGAFTPIVREEWVPDAHVHRLAGTKPIAPGGDPGRGRGCPPACPPASPTQSRSRPAATRSPAGGCSCGTATSRSRSASRPRRWTASTATARATRSSTSTAAPASCARCSARSPTARRTTS